MSVRLWLTLWYTGLLCVALVIFAAAVVWQTDRAGRAAVARVLADRARDVTADLRLTAPLLLRPDAPDESGARLGQAILWIRVLDARGRLAVRQGPPLIGMPASLLSRTAPGQVEEEIAGDRRVLILFQPVWHGGRRLATIQLITTMDALDAQRRQLLAAMGIAGACITALAIAGGMFLADRALRPVARITALAARIGAGDLHRRVSNELRADAVGKTARHDELGRLATTFDAMLARLEAAAEQRRDLTADVAHELGTPMATIRTGAEVALARQRHPEEYRATLQAILAESRHASRVLDDLLLLGRADAGRLPMQHELVEIDDLCRQAIQSALLTARARGIEPRLTVPAHPVVVWGDELRLGQVLRNLLDNALRHTPDGGAIHMSLQHGEESTEVVLHVADSGPGIPVTEVEHIFARFHRATTALDRVSPPTDRTGGGLGLTICKTIVAAHGGAIRAVPELAGAHFVVTLPSAVCMERDREPRGAV